VGDTHVAITACIFVNRFIKVYNNLGVETSVTNGKEIALSNFRTSSDTSPAEDTLGEVPDKIRADIFYGIIASIHFKARESHIKFSC
jgi:hypothetical protein